MVQAYADHGSIVLGVCILSLLYDAHVQMNTM